MSSEKDLCGSDEVVVENSVGTEKKEECRKVLIEAVDKAWDEKEHDSFQQIMHTAHRAVCSRIDTICFQRNFNDFTDSELMELKVLEAKNESFKLAMQVYKDLVLLNRIEMLN